MRKEHVTLGDDAAWSSTTRPSGASGGCRACRPDAVEIVAALKRRRGGGDELLAYHDGRALARLRSDDINAYIKEVTGGDFSAKDFRTWSATVLAAVALAVPARSPARRPAASAPSRARSRRSRTTSATRPRCAAPPTSTRACSTPTTAG